MRYTYSDTEKFISKSSKGYHCYFQYLCNIVKRSEFICWSGAHCHALINVNDILVGVCGVRGRSGSACARVGSNTGSSTTLMLLLCMMSCSMLKISSAREHLKANIPAECKKNSCCSAQTDEITKSGH